MRRIGVTAATFVLALLAAGCGEERTAVSHSCGATDQRFIQIASLNLTALGSYAEDYRRGLAEPDEVARLAFDAAKRVAYHEPTDPALRAAQKLLNGMFTEYGRAVELHAEGKQAGPRMHRAYGLANFAREVLLQAQPALAAEGCDVTALL